MKKETREILEKITALCPHAPPPDAPAPRGIASERAAREARERRERLALAAPAEILAAFPPESFRELRRAALSDFESPFPAPADFLKIRCPACGRKQYTFARNLADAVKSCVQCGKLLRLSAQSAANAQSDAPDAPAAETEI